MKVMVTGATGFVGSALAEALAASGTCSVRCVSRRSVPQSPGEHYVLDLSAADQAWASAVEGVEVIVHCAARVHVMSEVVNDPLTAYREVNVAGTLALARRAAIAGVKRFIFLSSIKVNGEVTHDSSAFTAEDIPAPVDAYGISKWEAEIGLHELAQSTGMEVVIIRPVLVYGPGVKGNVVRMMASLYKGTPLPLGAIHNRRSMVALDNLVDLIITCITHPKAVGQTFLVSDGEDVSTTELLVRMADALGTPARLIPFPVSIIEIVAGLLGKGEMAQRLCKSLQVDMTQTCKTLGWHPPVSLEHGLKMTADAYLLGAQA